MVLVRREGKRMRLHRLILGTIAMGAALAVAVSAASADGGARRSINYGEPAPFSWTGLYVGGTAGGGWGDTRFDDSGFLSNRFDIDGFVGFTDCKTD